MGVSATFTIDATSREVALVAADWIPRFYPLVAIATAGDRVTLRSDHFDAARLEAIWASALANEQLHARASAMRRAAFESLRR
ncbi:hypothetical protein [Sphingomonas sp. UNC305MFCol5.2]|uniref:hypothetical protein n=1 Tax=Sphingomonas sp. UNC305MFCol5.2 TaxID=1449076 RepID=UPI0004A753D3|nr:hypothetical protein [Sphingomonas sp. UNC305MFCol5.2]